MRRRVTSRRANGGRVRLYLDQPARLQEGQAVLRPVDDLLDLFAQFGQLLSDFKVGDHALLVGNLNAVILFFILLYFCKQQKSAVGLKKKKRNHGTGECEQGLTLHHTGQGPVVLELIERLLQHVLGVDLLHSQQVEHHVVGEVKGAV